RDTRKPVELCELSIGDTLYLLSLHCLQQPGTCRDKRWGWRKDGGVGGPSQSVKLGGKNIKMAAAPSPGVVGIEKNQTSADHSAPFTLQDHPGCRKPGGGGVGGGGPDLAILFYVMQGGGWRSDSEVRGNCSSPFEPIL
ncbi:hypothetical protein KUCAC02_016495, partial [Chaenocephalus aceratus]